VIKDKAKRFISDLARKRLKLLGVEETSISSATDLVKEGIYDSLSFVDLVVECENKFNVEIDLEKYGQGEFTQVGKLAEIIEEATKIK
jgi:acyl carrier protein